MRLREPCTSVLPRLAHGGIRHQRRQKFLLLSTVILAPATLLYVKARSERGRRLFTPTEIALCALIVAGGITGVVGLWTGFLAV
ncbi:hypothetical protein AB0368_34390 [Actinoplanes sp. NPDC051475]|uniref:hypothetical protein n=1 Tax=Actinoplanes sp. NPDC051475 TaxID=3157225 RepID=UPI003450B50F